MIIEDKMGKRATIQFNLKDVAEATGVSYDIVRVASKKKIFDRHNLLSIAHYIIETRRGIKLKKGIYYIKENQQVTGRVKSKE